MAGRGGAGQGQVAAPHLEISCAAVCRGVPLVLVQTRQMLRVRKPLQDTEPGPGPGSQPSAAACVCFKPCPRHTTVSCYCIWSTGPVFVKLWCSPEYLLRLAVWLIKILKTAHPINEGLCGQASKLLEPSMRLPSLNIVNILLELVVRCSCLLSV